MSAPDDAIDFSADAAPEPTDGLARVTQLALALMAAQLDVTNKDRELSVAKENARKLEQEDLPELMRELTLTELKLENGFTVKVLDDVQCGISVERRPGAHAWLVEHGFGGLIKTELQIEFGRDEQDEAAKARDEIAETIGREVVMIEAVHPATLKSFIKEQLAGGVALPTELFGIHPFVRAKIEPPKKVAPKKFTPK